MELSINVELENEALRFYLSEVKISQQESEAGLEEEENIILNEIEQATDFLQKAGLSDLSKLYQEGKEISDHVVNDSVSFRNLTEKQAQTIKSRVRTLNKTLKNHQPRRKQRQDIRDVAWKTETSSTGTRSRSATPDSLDSADIINDDTTSDEDQQLSLPSFPVDSENMVFKGKLKWTSSEPFQNKFSKTDRSYVAHLGSTNVILKGYQPLNEYGTLTRERSGSDPTTDVIDSGGNDNPDNFIHEAINVQNNLSRSHNSLLISNNSNNDPVYLIDNDCISFERLLKKNEELHPLNKDVHFSNIRPLYIDDLTDGECQHLKSLLWVEVTSIFDQYKIPILKRKSNIKNTRGNVFGVKLSSLIMRDMPKPIEMSMVPQVFQSIVHQLNIRCLDEDGILRVAGNQQKINFLYNEIEAKFYSGRKYVENILSRASVHDLTGVLKKLIRDLPDTIFTMELFDMFYKCSMIPSHEDQFKALNLLVLLLPVEHCYTFRLLLNFCINIIAHEDQNRMNLHNVAMITAPTFFPPRLLLPKENSKINLKSQSREELVKHINDAAICCSIMEQILNNGENLWIVPSDLAQQAKEAHKKAHNRKDSGKEKKPKYGKKKLYRSSTQYEPGAMIESRIKKKDLYM